MPQKLPYVNPLSGRGKLLRLQFVEDTLREVTPEETIDLISLLPVGMGCCMFCGYSKPLVMELCCHLCRSSCLVGEVET